jgi:hypothetical protein
MFNIGTHYGMSTTGKLYRTIADQISKSTGETCSVVEQYAMEITEGKCVYCGKQFPIVNGKLTNIQWDHIIPASFLGVFSRGNIFPACPSCNNDRGNMNAVEYYKQIISEGKSTLYTIDEFAKLYKENTKLYKAKFSNLYEQNMKAMLGEDITDYFVKIIDCVLNDNEEKLYDLIGYKMIITHIEANTEYLSRILQAHHELNKYAYIRAHTAVTKICRTYKANTDIKDISHDEFCQIKDKYKGLTYSSKAAKQSAIYGFSILEKILFGKVRKYTLTNSDTKSRTAHNFFARNSVSKENLSTLEDYNKVMQVYLKKGSSSRKAFSRRRCIMMNYKQYSGLQLTIPTYDEIYN